MAEGGARKLRVGVLTFFEANNCGANLQALALTEAIGEMGAQCEIIRYRKERPKVSQAFVRKKHGFRGSVHELVVGCMAMQRKKAFSHFRNKYMAMSRKEYFGEEILEANPRYDVFVTGSDQVWNDRLNERDDAYFLNFVSESSKKCAYAPSFGRNTVFSEERAREVGKMLADFRLLSGREEDAVRLIGELSGREAPRVPDPVILRPRERWDQVAGKPSRKKPFVFLYTINFTTPEMIRAIQTIESKEEMEVVVHQRQLRHYVSGRHDFMMVPDEFLRCVRDAEIILTDSYHATLFSILFHKNFWTFAWDRGKGYDARIAEVLKIYGQTARWVQGELADPFLPADHRSTDERVRAERERGLAFIRKILYL